MKPRHITAVMREFKSKAYITRVPMGHLRKLIHVLFSNNAKTNGTALSLFLREFTAKSKPCAHTGW